MILRLAFCQPIITPVGFLDGGPSHYRHFHQLRQAPVCQGRSECKHLISTTGFARNHKSLLGVLTSMRVRAAVGISAVIVILTGGALLVFQRPRFVPLSTTELAIKHIAPPSSWADPDCGKLRRAVRTAVRDASKRTATNMAALSPDEVAVYRAVVQQWNSNGRRLSVANRTFALDDESLADRISNCECLRSMDVQSLANASHSFHALTRSVFPERNIRLVDADKQLTIIPSIDPNKGLAAGKSVEKAVSDAFAGGLFSLSEIAFDRDHRQALVSYGFVCGSLCGSGGTWLFEKVDGVWNHAKGG